MHNAQEMLNFIYVSLAIGGGIGLVLLTLGIYGLYKYFNKGIK